jgi:hypothetical protein
MSTTQAEITDISTETGGDSDTDPEANDELETVFSDEQTRPFAEIDYHERDEAMSARIETLAEQLIEDAQAARDSDAFRQWAETNAKFHNYSARNSLLIQLQHPGATRVAGYKQWQDDHNRHVKEGETAIWILGFNGYRDVPKCPECGSSLWSHYYDDLDCKHDVDNGGDPDGDDDNDTKFYEDWDFNPYNEWQTREKPQFKPVTVYALEQTEGEPLPELPTEATGDADLVEPARDAATELGHNVEIVPSDEWNRSADGTCNTTATPAEIRVERDTPANTASVLIHETAHAELHRKAGLDTQAKEVEAEAVAFIVAEHFGLDSSGSAFYLASWADDTQKEITDRLDRIKQAARNIIEAIEAELEE